ncbi:hypothetical protein A2W14_05040 [Candidatus Gottesmanbacteria bacterium RBG_16_37_8]|uniref:Uncharacterized protein n=1 Tax=Candidatus Gottesmanbacteria bacterium RBG_16_37_8 TaxID=1798371 RepID=A0A1F5YUT4_9BACT|nr:MAG: hypothetical protein A2W14_05040 [Candidatus Gottesmanbacteria bacterium RBG_16_37_8]
MFKDATKHSLILLTALFLTFLWVENPFLVDFSLQLTAALIIFLVLAHKIFKIRSFLLTESTVSVISVALITSATGGLTSPFFFLNLFLLFELSLLLEPSIAIILTLSLMVFYLFTNQVGPSLYNLTAFLSFLFMTPLAYLVGNIYRKVINQRKEINNLSRKIENLEYGTEFPVIKS